MPSATNGTPNGTTDVRDLVKEYPICLVTGGAGYIGSHTVLELLNAGVAVVVLDNLVNSHDESLNRVWSICKHEHDELITGKVPPPLFFHKVDLRDERKLKDIFAYWQQPDASLPTADLPVNISEVASKRHYHMLPYVVTEDKRPKPLATTTDQSRWGKINSVIHFAALKAVGESVTKPLEYYDNNITGLLVLLRTMQVYNVKELVFSSSAVVYGRGNEQNITEDVVQVNGQGGSLTNPYGRSKWFAEEILNDLSIADPDMRTIALRYFNPTGANQSGLLGENPKGMPNNIVPVILQAYQRRRSKVVVFGSNYDTSDGTGVRDYIHVKDLASGHLAALRKLNADSTMATVLKEELKSDKMRRGSAAMITLAEELPPNYNVYNLGTGQGYSVLEILSAFSSAAGVEIPFQLAGARTGDLGTVTANASKAQIELEWEAEFGLQDMCRDVFNFAAENPAGYEILRRLSTIAAPSAQTMRKASVAAGIFKSDNEFDAFMTSAASIGRRDSGFGVPLNGMMKKLRMGSVAGGLGAIPEGAGAGEGAWGFGDAGVGRNGSLSGEEPVSQFKMGHSSRPAAMRTMALPAFAEEDEAFSPTAGR